MYIYFNSIYFKYDKFLCYSMVLSDKKKKKKKRQCICKWHFKYRKVELNSSWRQKKHINPQYSYKFWKAVDVVLKIILEKKTLRYLIAGSILLNPRKIGIAA